SKKPAAEGDDNILPTTASTTGGGDQYIDNANTPGQDTPRPSASGSGGDRLPPSGGFASLPESEENPEGTPRPAHSSEPQSPSALLETEGMHDVDQIETQRGAFYTANPPDVPTLLTVQVPSIDRAYTFLVPFTQQEIAHLRRAHEALQTPAFLQSVAETSRVRPLLSYARLPWGRILTDRSSAL